MHGNIFFTSDLHLMHKKIREYCPYSRKGDTPEQMTEIILNNISDQTKPGDIIYDVGDFSFGTQEQTESAIKQIAKMNVQHHLILGNHDKMIRNNQHLQSLFTNVQDVLNFSIGKQVIVLNHYAQVIWDRKHYGSWHLFGHSHGGFRQEGKCMDVGLDTRPSGDMTMWSLEEVSKIMLEQPTGRHH